ncbi:hypothetical protein [Dyadobacter aurulentus]|uniref:hypothetical protein n=1 Tax=Dyadobacter sp. UC 10 TaxID=2605428 RepID=UPI0011F272F6|nr:hypothetical protein [Dyadobacter sp. UC 10]KAA0993459.1 hypothetical protein FXO21_26420 [Dyadobacter sp. UC 10]
MHSQQISKGLASILNALSKVDGMFRNKQFQNAGAANKVGNQSDLPVYAHFIQENMHILGQNAGLPFKYAGPQPIVLNELTERKFLNILNRVANGPAGVSRQERFFVQQVWSLIGSKH